MSNEDLDAVADELLRVHGGARPRRIRALAVAGVAALSLGLAACGDDDDDAADTVPGATDDIESTLPDTTRPATTRPSTTAGNATTEPATDEAGPTTTAAGGTTTAGRGTTTAAGGTTTVGGTADAAPEGTDTDATEDTAAPTGTEAPTGTDATGDTSAVPGTASPSGPTTTGPECEFVENVEFPIERCNRGDPVAALQSVLQVLGYEIGTVDCAFGDQTLYAVRAFQGDRDLTVDGVVGPDTWAALDVPLAWGDDADGSGTLEPNEINFPDQC